MSKQKIDCEFSRPFGPFLGRFSIPEKLIAELNAYTDAVAKDRAAQRKADHSPYLAGEVTQEIKVSDDIVNGPLGRYLMEITAAYVHAGTGKRISQFTLKGCWIVRSFAGDFNPPHAHSGHVSGAGYLMVPPQIGTPDGSRKEAMSSGYLNFMHSAGQFLSPGNIEIKPEVGQIYVFPHYLLHSVNPFSGEGERRSFSFNAEVDGGIFDIFGGK